MNQAKGLAGDRIGIALAQVTQVVGVLKLSEVSGIVTRFPVVKADRPGVLLAPVVELQFLVTPNFLRYLWCGDGETQHNQSDEKQHGYQDVSVFGIASGRAAPSFGHLPAIIHSSVRPVAAYFHA